MALHLKVAGLTPLCWLRVKGTRIPWDITVVPLLNKNRWN
jgi:hypothetical protein